MSDHPPSLPPDESNAMKRGFMGPVRTLGRLAIQAMILIFLLDGMVDVTIPVATKIGRTSAEIIDRLNNNVTARDWRQFSERNVPGIGAVSNPMNTPTIHVDARGRRATGQAVRGRIHGVLLGASQAVGFMVADDATLAAALERQLPDVSIDNYAGDGRTVTDNMTRWLTLHDALDDTDFTILLAGGMQVSRACRVFPEPPEQPVLRDLWRQFVNKTPLADPAQRRSPCATPEAQDAVITHTLFEMRAAVDAARRENRRLAIILAPTLFGNHAQTGTLRDAFSTDVAETLDSVFRDLRLRLAAKPIPGVYDLSDAFDTSPKTLFRDSGSHFDRQGSALLARAIIARIPAAFFTKAIQPSCASATDTCRNPEHVEPPNKDAPGKIAAIGHPALSGLAVERVKSGVLITRANRARSPATSYNQDGPGVASARVANALATPSSTPA